MSQRSLTGRAGWFLVVFSSTLAWFWHLHGEITTRNRELEDRTTHRLRVRPVIFFGDSHIECSVDDDLHDRILNLATSSEHYVFTLQKLRRFRPQVAVIGAGVHNFLPYYERNVGPVYLSRFDIWTPTMTRSERADVLARMDFEAASFARIKRVLPFLGTQLDRRNFLKRKGFGGFYDRGDTSRVSQLDARHRFEEMSSGQGETPSLFQARYLKAILEHLEHNRVEIVLLSTPVHSRLRQMIPGEARASFRQLIRSLARRFRLRYWDYSEHPFADELYRDPDHLNLPGAQQFTLELVNRLDREGLLPDSRRRADGESSLANPGSS